MLETNTEVGELTDRQKLKQTNGNGYDKENSSLTFYFTRAIRMEIMITGRNAKDEEANR